MVPIQSELQQLLITFSNWLLSVCHLLSLLFRLCILHYQEVSGYDKRSLTPSAYRNPFGKYKLLPAPTSEYFYYSLIWNSLYHRLYRNQTPNLKK